MRERGGEITMNKLLNLINDLNKSVETNEKIKLSEAINLNDYSIYDLFLLLEIFKGNFVESKDIDGVVIQFDFVPLDSKFKVKNLKGKTIFIYDYLVVASEY